MSQRSHYGTLDEAKCFVDFADDTVLAQLGRWEDG